ncbi:MAG TPA: PQQ-binding-like beta-propeller repeat protein, partial [Acidothermaceae bacterium]|nr:PQQ-binding-like beta-propeller repeat protein [Acidothermaceae bacterium]
VLAACTSSKRAAPAASAPVSTDPAASAAASSAPVLASAAASSPVAASSSAGSASSATTSPRATAAAFPTGIWPTYHHDVARTGNAGTIPAVKGLKVAATASLDGAVYASPLVLHDAKGDLIIAATENNTLYALRNNGSIAWSRHIGTPVNGSSLPCGNINPTGITGTPVYDPATGLVFAVAFLSGDKHVLVAVNAETGTLAWTRPVDPPGSHPNVEQERGALLLSGGKVWVPYGGLYGDCGPYHGYVVGIPTSGQGAAAIYQVPSSREAGIWTPAGPSADAAGHVYVSVGNSAQTNPKAAYDMGDSVIELSGTSVVSFFAPATWADDNAQDLDLGTTGPVILPTGQVFVAGKNGNAYLMKQGALGGLGGKIPSIAVCTAFGGAAYSEGTIYVPCTNGVRAVHISETAMTASWHASPSGSPIVGGGAVLTVAPSSGTLFALDPVSGATKAQVALGDSTTRFATPAMAADGFAYVGTEHGKLVIVATG